MTFRFTESAAPPIRQVPFVNGDDPRLVPPVAEKRSQEDLLLIAGLREEEPEPEAPSRLILPPDLVIAPDRDARYRPPSELTRKVLDRIAQRAAFAKALPTTLVVVAHPDDEAIGAGGLLAGLPDAVVAHVTDGAPRDERYAHSRGFQTREEYARARRREVANALSHVGITPERCRGLGYVDGEASLQLLELVFDVAELMDEVRPDIVLTHPYEGGHSDHDATAFAVHLACGILRRDQVPTPMVFELTSYHNFSGTRRVLSFLPYMGSEEATIKLTEAEKALKKRMYDEFASQRQVLERFPIGIERFRPAPRYVFTKAPHEGQLDYERFCTLITGAQWRQNAGKALEALRTRRRRFVQSAGIAQPFRRQPR
ncbi:MAG TPA: PIG-L family deacetylase [Gemmatimonadaceae bacterium]|nr:PIG-L family deacetylase [Gemmatimonadaceae bacterium]